MFLSDCELRLPLIVAWDVARFPAPTVSPPVSLSVQLTDILQEVREEVQHDHERKLEQLTDGHRRELNSIREKYLDEVRGCFGSNRKSQLKMIIQLC